MTTILNLDRRSYLQVGGTTKRPALDYMSAKYKNIKFVLNPTISYVVTSADAANLPGISFNVYGSRDYWWVIALCNGILDPISGLTPGLVLQLPTLADINAFLSTQDAQQLSTSVTI